MKSEGSQHVYKWFKTAKNTEFGNRISVEVGNIKELEKDEVMNYILIPTRTKDGKGKEHTTSWSIHKIKKECEVQYEFDSE